MCKGIQNKQNGCKRLAEQTILTTEKCDLWQHDPRIGAFLLDKIIIFLNISMNDLIWTSLVLIEI